MIIPPTIARRVFIESDQISFADISGDYNPLHIDPQASLHMPAGACVVHGVHAMLWALQALSAYLPLAALSSLQVNFTQFLYLHELVELRIQRSSDVEVKAELRVGLTQIAQYVLHFGEITTPAVSIIQPTTVGICYPAEVKTPLALDWTCRGAVDGTVSPFRTNEAVSGYFPALAVALGAARLNSILTLTRLVGMVAPGLHSTFHSLNLKMVADIPSDLPVLFSVNANASQHQVFVIPVRSTGISGTVTASRRPARVPQLASAQIRHVVGECRFEHNCALVVGGSRGIGELTAKVLGALGVSVIVTYSSSQEEAEAVASDIRSEGGNARAMHFDVLRLVEPQIAQLNVLPRSIYYFATPRISRRREVNFSQTLFREFYDFYVDGFQKVALATAQLVQAPVRIFYPSTVFIEKPVKHLREYVAAKAAGEALAETINRSAANIYVDVARLPRLATDQTSGIITAEFESTLSHILPMTVRTEAAIAAMIEAS